MATPIKSYNGERKILSPTPQTVFAANTTSDKRSVVIATNNLFINDAAKKDADIMADMLFEQIGAQELSGILSPGDTSPLLSDPGQSSYKVKNIADIMNAYSPQKIISLQDTDKQYFKAFPLVLSYYVPTYGSGPNNANIYSAENGDIVIDVINMSDFLRVEVEIFTIEDVLDDTIYMEELP